MVLAAPRPNSRRVRGTKHEAAEDPSTLYRLWEEVGEARPLFIHRGWPPGHPELKKKECALVRPGFISGSEIELELELELELETGAVPRPVVLPSAGRALPRNSSRYAAVRFVNLPGRVSAAQPMAPAAHRDANTEEIPKDNEG